MWKSPNSNIVCLRKGNAHDTVSFLVADKVLANLHMNKISSRLFHFVTSI